MSEVEDQFVELFYIPSIAVELGINLSIFLNPLLSPDPSLLSFCFNCIIQGGPEKMLLGTIDSFVVNSNFCEPPCRPSYRRNFSMKT